MVKKQKQKQKTGSKGARSNKFMVPQNSLVTAAKGPWLQNKPTKSTGPLTILESPK